MMSKTDRTRPMWVQRRDPHNERFKMVGRQMWPTDGTSEHFWKKVDSCHRSSCCYGGWERWDERKKRTAWRSTRQQLLAAMPEDRDALDW